MIVVAHDEPMRPDEDAIRFRLAQVLGAEDRERLMRMAEAEIRRDLAGQLQPFVRLKNDWRARQGILRVVLTVVDRYLPTNIVRCVFIDEAESDSPSIHVSCPRYTHDCDLCRFLGTFGEFDLYACAKAGYRTFIARFGDEGPAYTSGPGPFTDELREAMRRDGLVPA